MRRLLLAPFLLSLLFLSCQKEIKDPFVSSDVIAIENQRLSATITKQTTQTRLNGYIINEQRQPVSGATVSCAGKTVTTDSKGFFYFKDVLTVNKDYALISVSKTGFMKNFRTFTPNRNRLAYHTEKIMLQQEGIAQQVPSTGGSITTDNIKLTFPAGSIIKPGGNPYSGNIRVVARYINPGAADFPLMIPGTLSGLNDAGEIKALQSFGMATVDLFDAAGNKLQIAAGQTVKMELPAPANGPATIPLWHFNESYGIWVQQGIAKKEGNVYVAEVNHFSIWNIDLEFNDFEVNLKFQVNDSIPLSNMEVRVYRANDIYIKTFFTDNAGEGTMINCPSAESLILKMIFTCDTFTHIMAPVTQSRNEIVTVNDPDLNIYSLSGTLRQCNNQPLTNQAFHVFLTGSNSFVTINGITNSQGQFTVGTVIPDCQVTSLNAQATAFYNNQYFFSGFTAVSPGTNPYSPVLCDTSGAPGIFNDSDVVNIPDPALQQLVRQKINKPTGPIYYIDVKTLHSLSASGLGIQNLTGLQYFTGLDSLHIWYNQGSITSINPVTSLTQLTSLVISIDSFATQTLDITQIQNLTALRVLALTNCGISNITPLQDLTSLRELYLFDNQITSITPLQNLVALRELFLNNNNISDISPVQNISTLLNLILYDNQLTTIIPIMNKLPNLTMLDVISGNTVPGPEISSFQATHPNCIVQ